MKRIHQVTGAVFFAIGLFLLWQGRKLGLENDLGPAPGFFPFWIGVALAGFSLIWVVQVSLAAPTRLPDDLVPEPPQRRALAIAIVSLVAFMLLMRPLGFNLAMLGLLLFLFFANGRDHPLAKIVIAFAASFGVHYVFEQYLRVPLPYAGIEALRQIGL